MIQATIEVKMDIDDKHFSKGFTVSSDSFSEFKLDIKYQLEMVKLALIHTVDNEILNMKTKNYTEDSTNG